MYNLNKQAYINIIQLLLELVLLVSSYFISFYIASISTKLQSVEEYFWILLIFIPVFIFSMNSMEMYNTTTFRYVDRIVRNCLFSIFTSSLFLASMIFFIKEKMFSRSLFVHFVVITTVIIISERLIYNYLGPSKNRKKKESTKVIIVGSPHVARKYRSYIRKTNIKINIVGYVRVRPSHAKKNTSYNLGYIQDLENIIKNNIVDEVIFALPKDYVGKVEPYILLCEEMGITVRMVLNLYDLKLSKTHLTSIGTFPVLTFHTVSLNNVQLLLKRTIDIAGSLIGLLLTGLLSIFIVPAIKLDSPGPVIFCQDRVGQNGRLFKLYKFRSMSVDAEEQKQKLKSMNEVDGGLMFKIKNDPRVTKVGAFLRKTSLDELPQFLNVLKGDMSLVGTRPPTVDEVSKYLTCHRRRISIKPGITGLWQISGRSSITDFDEVVRLDTTYIDRWSIWLDIKIIIQTFIIVFRRKGAF